VSPKTPISAGQAIHQTRPFQSLRQEAVVALLLAADAARETLQRGLEPHGVTLQQYNVLRILRGAGPTGLPTLEIGERMVERSPGVTRLIDRLVEKGMVTRRRASADRRQVVCRASARALKLLAELDPVVDALDASAAGDLSEVEVRQLVELLDRLRNAQP
jgi:DNA-binding MarR family transcriptional regulator